MSYSDQVPVENLDFEYVRGCSNGQELEAILKELRSNKHGLYPDLENYTESKLRKINPKSSMLQKTEKATNIQFMPSGERVELTNDLDQWLTNIKDSEKFMHNTAPEDSFIQIPDIRSPHREPQFENYLNKTSQASTSKTPNYYKSSVPKSPEEWLKIETELESQMNEKSVIDETKEKDTHLYKKVPLLPKEQIPTSDKKRLIMSDREREKGNEAYRSNDLDEAIDYYRRSLQCMPTVAANNNLALIYLMQKNDKKALEVCNEALKIDPDNLKSHLRRAKALKHLNKVSAARTDANWVLEREPNNKLAKEILQGLSDMVEGSNKLNANAQSTSDSNKTKKKRVFIEEVSSASNTNDDEKANQNVTPNATPASDDSTVNAESLITSPIPAKTNNNNDTSATTTTTAPTTNNSSNNSSNNNNNNNVEYPPLPIWKEPTWLTELRSKAVDYYKSGYYGDSLSCYQNAIERLNKETNCPAETFSSLTSNCAACKLKIGDAKGAISDCTAALRYDPLSAKSWLRRASAFEIVENIEHSYADYSVVVRYIEYNNKIAQDSMTRLQLLLKDKYGNNWRSKLPSSELVNDVITALDQRSQQQQEVHTEHNTNTAGSSSNNNARTATATKGPETISKPVLTYDQYKELGNQYFTDQSYPEAIEAYTSCIKLDPYQSIPYTNRALIYLKTNQPFLAKADANKALELNPKNVKALYRRAQAFRHLQEYKESIKDLNQIIKLDKSNSSAKKELNEVKILSDENLTSSMSTNNTDNDSSSSSSNRRKKVKIEQVDSSDIQNSAEKSKVKNVNNPVKDPPTLPFAGVSQPVQLSSSPTPFPFTGVSQPVQLSSSPTPFEFATAWNSLKATDDLSLYIKLIEPLSPSLLPKLISNKLDEQLLSTLCKCAIAIYSTQRDAERGLQILEQLINVDRFRVVLMFLSKSQRSEISEALNSFVSNSVAQPDRISKLIEIYSK